ncbi:MAG: 2-amino-4-hydroxy-6-hydroxymethyldihydropteridine diphosphokinase [Armatimonadota bacterium]|nr:2-amino-4-hydroxy-6-hydroxymethyldihydropteridine diphosphokinase [Armatimonadota bacterium]
MPTAFLGLGSNLGDREENLRSALQEMEKRGAARTVKVSSFYETAPVGYTDQPDFINAVAQVETMLQPAELLATILDVEKALGRERTIRWGPRVIDIDILLYDDISIEEPGLVIPHPEMTRRGFVLKPLAEIAPDLILPGGNTAREAAEVIASAELKD